MSIQQEKLKAIADKIRYKTGETNLIKPNDFVNKIDDVYESGMLDIVDNIDGMYRFFTNGQNMELLPYVIKHDWKGRTINMQYAFQDNKLIEEFTPPKNIKVTSPHGMLSGCSNLKTVSGLDKMIIGIVLTDLFHGCTSLEDAGTLNFEGVTAASRPFQNCTALKEIRILGNIGLSVSFGESIVLSKESIISIVEALGNNVTGKTLTLSQTAVNAIDWNDTVIDGVTYNTWEEVIGARNNWTITLS